MLSGEPVVQKSVWQLQFAFFVSKWVWNKMQLKQVCQRNISCFNDAFSTSSSAISPWNHVLNSVGINLCRESQNFHRKWSLIKVRYSLYYSECRPMQIRIGFRTTLLFKRNKPSSCLGLDSRDRSCLKYLRIQHSSARYNQGWKSLTVRLAFSMRK